MLLEAVEHLRPMKGGAQSHLMRAEDGRFYVVKFRNNPQHARVLANEWLAARLAQALGMPVPEPAIIVVPEALTANAPNLVLRIGGQTLRCAPGQQFGSRLVGDDPDAPIYDYLPESALATVKNLHDFWGLLLFDKWTCNCNGRQVVFRRPARNQPLRVYAVDQGFCFNAGEWNFPDSPLRGVYGRNCVYRDILGWESFEPWLSRLETLAPSVIYSAGDEIPPAWYGDADDLLALLRQLVARRDRVRRLVDAVRRSPRAPFPQWSEPADVAQARVHVVGE